MPENENRVEQAPESSFLQIAVWFGSQIRPVSDDFAVEIVDHEVWAPKYGPWEVKHRFEGLEPDAPYELLIHIGDPESEPVSIRFWAPAPRPQEQSYSDYLIDLTDDELVLVNPGFRSTERRFPRPQAPPTMSRVNGIWQRWGLKAVGGTFAVLFAIALVMNYFDEGEDDLGLSAYSDDHQVDILLRARLLEDSGEMVVETTNASGGEEQRVVTDPVWETMISTRSREYQWIAVENLSETGGVRCEILVNGELWIFADSFGRGVTATCEGYPAELLSWQSQN